MSFEPNILARAAEGSATVRPKRVFIAGHRHGTCNRPRHLSLQAERNPPGRGAGPTTLSRLRTRDMSIFSRRLRRRGLVAKHRPDTHRLNLEALEDRTLLSINPIVTENQLTGTAESVWGVGTGNATIQGFATD